MTTACAHGELAPTPCTRCGTFLCSSCRPSLLCPTCEARLAPAPIPLEDPSLPIWKRVLGTFWELTLRPVQFHERAARGHGIGGPLLFVFALNVVAALPLIIFLARASDDLAFSVATLGTWIVFPISRILFLTVLLHPTELYWKPGPRFTDTFRALTWSSTFSIFSIIPIVGPLAAAALIVGHALLGLRAVHPTRWRRAALLIPLLFLLLIAAFVALYAVFQSTARRRTVTES